MSLETVYCQFPCCIGQMRYVMILLIYIAVLINFCQRVAFSTGIVEMADHKKTNSVCPADEEDIIIRDIGGGKVKWTEVEQSYNLAGFYIGYVIAHIPAGILCDLYGAKYPLMGGLFLSSISTALLPLCGLEPNYWWIAFILRIFTGVGQSVIFPGTASLISRWIPPIELSKMGAFVFAGSSIGVLLGNLLTGMWLHQLKNWTHLFVIWGGIGVLFLIIFGAYVFSDPTTHPHINASELNYLKESKVMNVKKPLPAKKILSDKCVYGLTIMQTGHDLIIITLSNNLPKYINQVLGFSIRDNSLVSLIFFLQWISAIGMGALADAWIRRRNMSITTMRTLLTAISHIGAFTFFCFAVLSECDKIQALVFFALAIFFKGFFYAGGKINIIEISTNHAGFVMGVVNGISALAGPLISISIGMFSNEETFLHWQIIVGVMGFVEILSLFLYMFLSNAKRRDWDYAEDERVPAEGIPLGKKWFQELSDSEHQLRLVRNKQIEDTRKQAEKDARAEIKAGHGRRNE